MTSMMNENVYIVLNMRALNTTKQLHHVAEPELWTLFSASHEIHLKTNFPLSKRLSVHEKPKRSFVQLLKCVGFEIRKNF